MRATSFISSTLTILFSFLCFPIFSQINMADNWLSQQYMDSLFNVYAPISKQNASFTSTQASFLPFQASLDTTQLSNWLAQIEAEQSQTTTSSTGDFSAVGNGFYQSVIPPSPNSMALINQVQSDVHLYTGKLNANVPIYHLKSRDIEVPITLNYSSSGVKVNDLGSWVGLGWNLNGGGSITRVIKSLPDELMDHITSLSGIDIDAYGYLNLKDEVNIEGGGVDLELFDNYIDVKKRKIIVYANWQALSGSCENGCQLALDTEPDEFYFNFGGYSGKFVFDQDGKVHTIPHQNLVINESILTIGEKRHLVGFEVITPQGYTYTFGGADFSAVEMTSLHTTTLNNYYRYPYVTSMSLGGGTAHIYKRIPLLDPTSVTGVYNTYTSSGNSTLRRSGPYTSTWYLKKITSPSDDEITFEYTDAGTIKYTINRNYNVELPNLSADNLTDGNGSLDNFFISPEPPINVSGGNRHPTLQKFSYQVDEAVLQSKRLTSIRTDTDFQLDFVANTDRIDLYGDKRLDQIKLSFGTEQINAWNFDYETYQLDSLETDLFDLAAFNNGPSNTWLNSDFSFTYIKYNILNDLSGGTLDSTTFHNEYLNIIASEHRRLYLSGITQVGKNGLTQPLLKFDYEATYLPRRFSARQDVFGSFNRNNRGTLVPKIFYDCAYPTICNLYPDDIPLIGWESLLAPGEAWRGHFGIPDSTRSKNGLLHKITFAQTQGERRFAYEFNQYNGNPYGGLRVRQIIDDPKGDSPLKTRNYTYGTGFPISKRKRISQELWANYTEDLVLVNAYSMAPLKYTHGAELGYRKVSVSESGNGRTEYTFLSPEQFPNQLPLTQDVTPNVSISGYKLPYAPYTDYDWRRGLMDTVRMYGESGRLVRETSNIWEFEPDGFERQSILSLSSFIYNKWNANGIRSTRFRVSKSYYHADWFYLESTDDKLYDEEGQNPVQIVTNYKYSPQHFNLLESAFTNSDGKVYRTKNYYPEDVLGNGTLADVPAINTLINDRILNIPIITESYVADVKVGGSLLQFEDFSFGNKNLSLPKKYYAYYPNLGWEKEGETLEYTEWGFPHKTQRNHDPLITTYHWNVIGLPTKKEYGDWDWSYGWDIPSQTLTSITTVDGQTTNFSYDDFYRLRTIKERDDQVITEFSYFLRGNGYPKNQVQKYINYNDAPTNSTETQISNEFSDGLGRPLYTQLMGHAPSGGDVIIDKTTYDPIGRKAATYRQHGTNGDGFGPKFSWTYDGTPLNRMRTEDPPGPSITTTTYWSNSGNQAAVNCPSCPSGVYPTNSLMMVEKRDGNDHLSFTYSDIAGRLILSRKAIENGDYADTYYQYDDIGNLTNIIPPDAGAAATFTYSYDDYHRLTQKKIPGADPIELRYDALDRQVLRQDGNMRNADANKWLATKYDDYHRTTIIGWYYGSVAENPEIITSNILTHHVYGTSGVEIDKIKSTTASILDDPGWLNVNSVSSTYYYDSYGRVSSTTSQNHLGAYDQIVNGYDYADKLRSTTRHHTAHEYHDLLNNYTFDHAGRLAFLQNKINDEPTVVLSKHQYNIYDEIVETNLHANDLDSPIYLQSIDYAYNEAGWLKRINGILPAGQNIANCNGVEEWSDSFCGDLEVSAADFLRLRLEADELSVNCYDPCAALNEQALLNPDASEKATQEASLALFDAQIANSNINDFNYPTRMYRLKLYDGDTRIVMQEELPMIKGDYVEEQCLLLNDGQDNMPLLRSNGQTNNYTFGELLSLRQVETPYFVSPDCDSDIDPDSTPSCGDFSDTFPPDSMQTSTLFSSYYGLGAYADLTNYGNLSNALSIDGAIYEIATNGTGEAEYVIGKDITSVQGTTVHGYKVNIQINFFKGTNYAFGLHDGTSFIPVNGGLNHWGGSATSETITLIPDELPSAEQIATMRIAILVDGYMHLDGAAVNMEYSISCDCFLDAPACSQLETEQQQAAYYNLQAAMANLDLTTVLFPTTLHRVILCDGTELYLLSEELAVLTGSYTIVQEIVLQSSSQMLTIGGGGLDRKDLFALRLYYDEEKSITGDPLLGAPKYNGNIGNMTWQGLGREPQHYALAYDKLDRLLDAQYLEGDELFPIDNKYGVYDLSYDKRGNIKSLKRNGLLLGCGSVNTPQYGPIDDLIYTISPSNRLINIQELANTEKGFRSQGAGTYGYDANGNITYDPYKGIIIEYNYLNLPKKITFNSSEKIIFVYDASGNKLRKMVYNNNEVTIKDYVTGIEYSGAIDDMQLEAIYHAQGRITKSGDPVSPEYHYEYTLKDHLGNTRVMFSDRDKNGALTIGGEQSEVLQENHYYPFGMKMEGAWVPQVGVANAYAYNSKELQEDFGLDWLAFEFRYYDPSVGRFTGVDPIGDQFAWASTYNYAENRPIDGIDLWGLQYIRFDTTEDDPGLDAMNATPEERKYYNEVVLKGSVAGGSAIGLGFVGVGAAQAAYSYMLINPESFMMIGGVMWGLGTDADMPGGGDDIGRGVRNVVTEISTSTNKVDNAARIVEEVIKGGIKNPGPALEGGFSIPKYYTYSTKAGIEVFVSPHAFKHLEELGLNALNKYLPEYRKLLGQTHQKAINSAIEDVISRGPLKYDHMYKSGGNEIMFGAPRSHGELPAVKHFK